MISLSKWAERLNPKPHPNTLRAWSRDGKIIPPTFHEIRSLAARLWKAQGVDVRVLLGHKTEAMSMLYRDARGAEWVTVSGA